MTTIKHQTASPTARPWLSRRARRGIVAGYIHGISARHLPAPQRRTPHAQTSGESNR